MAYAALLLGLVLPVLVRGLMEQPGALRLEQRSGPQSRVTKDSDRGPETYGSWANAWDNGTQAEAAQQQAAQ